MSEHDDCVNFVRKFLFIVAHLQEHVCARLFFRLCYFRVESDLNFKYKFVCVVVLTFSPWLGRSCWCLSPRATPIPAPTWGGMRRRIRFVLVPAAGRTQGLLRIPSTNTNSNYSKVFFWVGWLIDPCTVSCARPNPSVMNERGHFGRVPRWPPVRVMYWFGKVPNASVQTHTRTSFVFC